MRKYNIAEEIECRTVRFTCYRVTVGRCKVPAAVPRFMFMLVRDGPYQIYNRVFSYVVVDVPNYGLFHACLHAID